MPLTVEQQASMRKIVEGLESQLVDAHDKSQTTRVARLNDQLDALTALTSKPHARQISGDDPSSPFGSAPRGAAPAGAGETCGYASHRDFMHDVYLAGSGADVTERLQPLAAVGSDEATGLSDPLGGFLVPTAYSPDLLETGPLADILGKYTWRVPMPTPRISLPSRVDKDHTDSVSGGLRVYRRAEMGSVNSSHMEMDLLKMTANSLMGVTFATEEILEDSLVSFVSLLQDGFRDEFTSRLMNERIEGSGIGEFLGVMNSPCLVSVPKEGGQAADTINGPNVRKMRARCYRYQDAVWLANEDCYEELSQTHIAGTNGDVNLFAPGNGVDVPDTLLGRPIHFTEYAKTLGDQGDILLGNWTQYLEGTYSPLQNASSVHVRFVAHERAFKFWMRNDGMPWWLTPMQPKNGANTISPFVVLDTRA